MRKKRILDLKSEFIQVETPKKIFCVAALTKHLPKKCCCRTKKNTKQRPGVKTEAKKVGNNACYVMLQK